MDNKLPLGIDYPIQRGESGMFSPSYDSIVAAKNNIKNLLLTRPGERPGRPDYGSSIYRLVMFEQNSDVLDEVVVSAIESDFARFLPELIIDSIEVDRSSEDLDIYRLTIRVAFRLSKSSTVDIVETNIII